MKTLIIGLAFCLSGCAATMVSAPGRSTNSKFAPSNEQSRPGTIKYLNQGADPVIEGRREDAYRQMYQACGGKYKIVAEGPRAEGGVAMPMGNSAYYADSQYWYITFKCES